MGRPEPPSMTVPAMRPVAGCCATNGGGTEKHNAAANATLEHNRGIALGMSTLTLHNWRHPPLSGTAHSGVVVTFAVFLKEGEPSANSRVRSSPSKQFAVTLPYRPC